MRKMYSKKDLIIDCLKPIVCFLLVCTIILAICLGIIYLCNADDTTMYNNGKCTECNGKYEIFDIEGNRYYYKCDDCSHIIMLHSAME